MTPDRSNPGAATRSEWQAYVRSRLKLPGLLPEREAEAVEELAQQIDDLCHEAKSSGADDNAIRELVDQHIPDWARLASELMRQDSKNALPLDRRVADDLIDAPASWWRSSITGLWGDLLYSARSLLAHRSFALTSILTLALGIGAATALFSIVNTMLLQPLPFENPDRLVRVTSLRSNGDAGGVSFPDFLDWKSRGTSFDRVAVYSPRNIVLERGEAATRVRGAMASAQLFDVLGARPSLGRTFRPEEEEPWADDVVVLSHEFWRDQFGADPNMVGQQIRLDGRPTTVIGIAAKGFRFPIDSEPQSFWITLAIDRRRLGAGPPLAEQRGIHYLNAAVARLKPGVAPAQADAELRALVTAMNKEHPEDNPRGVRVRLELDELVANVRRQWLALFAASASLLLIACANVANMLLARGATRLREVAVRLALGASRGRVMRQLLTEHALIGVLGGAAGIAVATWAIGVIRRAAPVTLPRLDGAGLDWSAIVFAVSVCLVSIALSGLVPALRASKQDPAQLSNLAGRGEAGRRMRQGIVIAQTSLAVVLLATGGLFMRTLMSLNSVDLGYRTSDVLSFRFDLPAGYTPGQERRLHDQLLEGLRAVPGVERASAAYAVPLAGRDMATPIEIEGRPSVSNARDEATINIVHPDYFETLGIAITGRDFTVRDGLDVPPVAMVNEAFVRRFFPDGHALGQHVKPGFDNGYGYEPLREIVAVVRDTRSVGLRVPPAPEVYVPAAQCPIGSTMVVIRTAVNTEIVMGHARRIMIGLDRSIPLYGVKSLEDYVSTWVVQPRFSSLLFGLFAALASALAGIGLYGLISYSVAQRTREIGLRVALGASPLGVVALVVRQGARVAVVGIGSGVALSLIVTRLIASELYSISARDPMTLSLVSLLLFAVTLAACFIPARQALRVDTVSVLRD